MPGSSNRPYECLSFPFNVNMHFLDGRNMHFRRSLQKKEKWMARGVRRSESSLGYPETHIAMR